MSSSILHDLPHNALKAIALALNSGRLQPPYSRMALSECLPEGDQASACAELERLRGAGMTPTQIGIVIDLLATERSRQQSDNDRIQMVWTGPDQEGPSTRDTGAVARELLGRAIKSLLITTFSTSRDPSTFSPVNDAMVRNPQLDVTLILHVDQPPATFANDFWTTKWPWPSRPKVFYDPRGTAAHPMDRALQHSKCIVADLNHVFITSSNYTESGHLRNIELGVLIHDPRLAARVTNQFRSLIFKHLLLPLLP